MERKDRRSERGGKKASWGSEGELEREREMERERGRERWREKHAHHAAKR